MKFIKNFILFLFFATFYQLNNAEAFSDKIKKNFMGLVEVRQGVLAHDRGWFGENREGFGPDYPILGLTQTSTGGSSLYYGGLTWDFKLSEKWFFNATTGIAYTNGLTKLPKGQIPTGDKKVQFGSEILHRGAIELGWNFYGKDTISLMFSHVSHAGILSDKNHGMDEFGVRYGYRF